jgi:O-antigen ligase
LSKKLHKKPFDITKVDLLLWKILLWLLAISVPVVSIVRARSFEANFLDTVVARAENEWGLDRIVPATLTLALIIICTIIILMLSPQWRKRLTSHSKPLFFFSLGISLAPLIATILIGDPTQPATFTCFLLLLSSFLLHPPETTWFIRNVRITLLTIFVYGSLLSILVAPSWAIQMDYNSSVAILSGRLFGTTNHPNALGPFALITLVLAFFPGAKLRGEILHLPSSIIVLILSQSKTTWIIALICLMIFIFKRWDKIHNGILKILIGLSFFAIISYGTALGAYFFGHQVIDILNNPEVLTLTGRLFIWIYAWGYWLENPWFGHGFAAWSSDKVIDNLSILNWAAPHAHNQFLQTLTEGGIIGEIILMGFFISILYTINRHKRTGQGVIILVITLFLCRSITEVIIDYRIGSPLLLLWIVLILVISWRKDNISHDKKKIGFNINSQT